MGSVRRHSRGCLRPQALHEAADGIINQSSTAVDDLQLRKPHAERRLLAGRPFADGNSQRPPTSRHGFAQQSQLLFDPRRGDAPIQVDHRVAPHQILALLFAQLARIAAADLILAHAIHACEDFRQFLRQLTIFHAVVDKDERNPSGNVQRRLLGILLLVLGRRQLDDGEFEQVQFAGHDVDTIQQRAMLLILDFPDIQLRSTPLYHLHPGRLCPLRLQANQTVPSARQLLPQVLIEQLGKDNTPAQVSVDGRLTISQVGRIRIVRKHQEMILIQIAHDIIAFPFQVLGNFGQKHRATTFLRPGGVADRLPCGSVA